MNTIACLTCPSAKVANTIVYFHEIKLSMLGLFQFIKSNLRWLLGGMLLTLFSSFGQTFFIAQFNKPIRETFGLSDGQYGMLYMGATLASAATLMFLGRTLDRFPISKIALLVIICLAGACAGMSAVDSVAMLVVVLYCLRLFGQGMMTHTSQTAMGKWYSAHRGRAISLTSPGHQIGEAILPTAVIGLVAWVGWRQTWWFAAIGLIVVALPSIVLLMKVERTPQNPDFDDPKNKKYVVRDWKVSEVIRDNTFWVLLVGVLAPAFIGTAVFFQQDHILEIKGWNPELFAASYVCLAIATVIFTLIGGWLVDIYSSKVLLPAFLVPMGVGCLTLSLSSGAWAIFVFMGLLGCSYGFSSALSGTLWPETYGTKYLGSIRAIASAAMVFSSALGPGVTGLAIDYKVDFQWQLMVMGIYCVVVSLLMLIAAKNLVNRSDSK
jgi:sugar phosphate permease